jgi:hypothetical protein
VGNSLDYRTTTRRSGFRSLPNLRIRVFLGGMFCNFYSQWQPRPHSTCMYVCAKYRVCAVLGRAGQHGCLRLSSLYTLQLPWLQHRVGETSLLCMTGGCILQNCIHDDKWNVEEALTSFKRPSILLELHDHCEKLNTVLVQIGMNLLSRSLAGQRGRIRNME